MISLALKIILSNNVYGVVGIDLLLDKVSTIIQGIKIRKNGKAHL